MRGLLWLASLSTVGSRRIARKSALQRSRSHQVTPQEQREGRAGGRLLSGSQPPSPLLAHTAPRLVSAHRRTLRGSSAERNTTGPGTGRSGANGSLCAGRGSPCWARREVAAVGPRGQQRPPRASLRGAGLVPALETQGLRPWGTGCPTCTQTGHR